MIQNMPEHRLSLIAFTRRGAELGRDICAALSKEYLCTGCTLSRFAAETGLEELSGTLADWTARAFQQSEAVVFVSACGIAVRSIAPFLKDKFTDPAVVVVDERGRYCISLLSGHMGGANLLSQEIAGITGGQPVISTATDLNGLFAADVWARKNNLHLCGRQEAKQVSAALLNGEPVGFHSDLPWNGTLPEGLAESSAESGLRIGIQVGWDCRKKPFPVTLNLVPKKVVLGIGCRKGIPESEIASFVGECLSREGIPVEAVREVCTIDRKGQEAGLLAFCSSHGWKLSTFSASQLTEVEGNFSHSAFVAQVTGVDNVCERAAVLGAGGPLILPKRKGAGVTVAAAVPSAAGKPGQWFFTFDQEKEESE